ncbi:MAG: YfhO family protein [Clostridia bacterium]|nr:YfhO family protein [Clostridia bacterium]
MLIYILLGGNFEEIKIYVNDNLLDYKILCNYNKMIPIGKVTKGENVTIKIEAVTDRFAVTDIYLYYENVEVLKKHYDTLSKNEVDLKQVSGRKFEGSFIIEDEEGYIVFSIPYDEGFSANIDGKNAEIINVADGFIAVKVYGKGEHIIKLSFVPSGFVMGAIISAFGIFMFVIWNKIIDKQKNIITKP